MIYGSSVAMKPTWVNSVDSFPCSCRNCLASPSNASSFASFAAMIAAAPALSCTYLTSILLDCQGSANYSQIQLIQLKIQKRVHYSLSAVLINPQAILKMRSYPRRPRSQPVVNVIWFSSAFTVSGVYNNICATWNRPRVSVLRRLYKDYCRDQLPKVSCDYIML